MDPSGRLDQVQRQLDRFVDLRCNGQTDLILPKLTLSTRDEVQETVEGGPIGSESVYPRLLKFLLHLVRSEVVV